MSNLRLNIGMARSAAVRKDLEAAKLRMERIPSDGPDLRSARAVLQSLLTQGETDGKWRTLRTDLERAAHAMSTQNVCIYIGTPLDQYRKSGWKPGHRNWKPLSTA